MKQLACEMCGSTDLIKQDGVFVCQSCGMKYSVEEARKMMVEGVVEVKGTVKIDTSDEINGLYELARRAMANMNDENALKFYEEIILKDSSSWEANFYTVYLKSKLCKIREIGTASSNLANCLESIFKLIKDNIKDKQEQKKAIDEIVAKLLHISSKFFSAYINHFNDIDPAIRHKFVEDCANNCFGCAQICYMGGYNLIAIFGDEYGDMAASLLSIGAETHAVLVRKGILKDDNDLIKKANETINKYNSSYLVDEPNSINSSQGDNSQGGGCYVATAVYGSYDCPQVWTLRRYRDYTLAETWHGRRFIKTYYAISPTLVKWFGHTEWFKKMWQGKLDRMVAKLQDSGVESTPYEDKEW